MSTFCSCQGVIPLCDQVKKAVAKFGRERQYLLEILGYLQTGRSYLEKETLLAVAAELDIPAAEVYGTATFYSLYSTVPRGKHVIRICENAPCHIDGAAAVLEAVKQHLGIDVHQTTADGLFTLETTSCLGICGVAPAMMVDDDVHGNLTPELAVSILGKR